MEIWTRSQLQEIFGLHCVHVLDEALSQIKASFISPNSSIFRATQLVAQIGTMCNVVRAIQQNIVNETAFTIKEVLRII